MPPSTQLFLASKSPRRQELLTQIGVLFRLVDVVVPEQQLAGELPGVYVQRLAEAKARAGALLQPGDVVLGADTIVVLAGRVLEKPQNEKDAISMLNDLSGVTHEVLTAVCLCRDQQAETLCTSTRVRFRAISPEEAKRYWATGEPADKAGGYGIQGFGSIFVQDIQGSYSCVVGLPLYETSQLLAQFGVPVWAGPEKAVQL